MRLILRMAAIVAGLTDILALGAALGSPPVTMACQAPALPTPTGNVVTVSTESQLQNAVANVVADQTIVIRPGTYNLAAGGGTLYFNKVGADNVTIRGATNNCDDVILVGAGMTTLGNTPFGIWVGGPNNLLIANLSIRQIYYSAIQIDPNYGSGTKAPHLYNVHLVDSGEQIVKASVRGTQINPTGGVANGIIEFSILEYTTYLPTNAPGGATYTNGVDVLGGTNWIIRKNMFRNIRSAPGQGTVGPAVNFWFGGSGQIVEGNLFLNCQRGIALGLGNTNPNTGQAMIMDSNSIARNNIIYRSATQSGDVGIMTENAPNTKILNNTALLSGTYPNAIEYRFPATTGVEIRYNLNDGAVQVRDGATGTVSNNVVTAQPAWFVDPSIGDLHLTSAAIQAIDHAQLHPDVTTDYDDQLRPIGSVPDIGADEFGGVTSVPAAPTNLHMTP